MALFRNRDRADRGAPAEAQDAASGRGAPAETAPTPVANEGLRKGTGMSSTATDRLSSLDQTQANAFLGRGTKVIGKIVFEGTARIEGQVEGEIAANDVLVVGESAVVTAQITGGTVVIKGRVTGDISASKKVEIRAPGRLFGNVSTPSLVIEEGVVFEGHCSMGTSERQADRKVTILAKEERPGEPATAAPVQALKAQGDRK